MDSHTRTRALPRRFPLVKVIIALLALAASIGALIAAGPYQTTSGSPEFTPTAEELESADLILFWGVTCTNCEAEREWLETVLVDHPDLDVVEVEVEQNAVNRKMFVEMGEELDFPASSWPVTVIDERIWIGFTESIQEDIANGIDLVLAGMPTPRGVYGTPGAGTCDITSATGCSVEEPVSVDVPLFGQVSLGDKSLLVSTLIIGFVDGVNPCSLWVISVLLTIVIRTASRRRVVAIGSTFLAVTAGMYALYIASIFSALNVIGLVGKIQLAVALVAAVFAVVSIKDYFAFKKGLSFTIKDSAKPGIYKRMRDAAGHHSLLPALGATVVLAVAVSLMETPCTAGFPVIWTGLLHQNGVGAVGTALLFVAYMIPFLLDEMIVFGIAIVTMRASKMQEQHGELLKLIAGTTMLALATTMVVAPGVMESPVGALAIFGAAFALAGLIHVITLWVRTGRVPAKPTN